MKDYVFILMPFVGGILIGLATAIMILFNGRVTGISAIAAGIVNQKKHDIAWRVLFILGLVISPIFYTLFHSLPEVIVEAGIYKIVIAGLLVGIGTRYGSGCTSGHGVCGIARLSMRSILATITFIISGAVVVFLMKWIG